jgi:hypothetical protein
MGGINPSKTPANSHVKALEAKKSNNQRRINHLPRKIVGIVVMLQRVQLKYGGVTGATWVIHQCIDSRDFTK